MWGMTQWFVQGHVCYMTKHVCGLEPVESVEGIIYRVGGKNRGEEWKTWMDGCLWTG